MKEKILALLQSKFAGVRKDGLNQLATIMALTVTTEEEATQTVEKLTDETVGQFVTDWRKETDAEISKANKTHEENLKKKFNFVEKGNPNPRHAIMRIRLLKLSVSSVGEMETAV